jgi:organic hydroperoxide reductase OsmC/OhrA
MKIPITRAHARVQGSFYEEGSVLRSTAASGCEDISLELEIEAPGESDDIASLVRNAEQMCYVSQIVKNPVGVRLAVKHNGASVEVSDYGT